MTSQDDSSSPYSPLKPAARSIAVAIKGSIDGDSQSDAAPQIIVAGRGRLAADILKTAFARGIKVREDADLAELLVRLDLDTPIPSEAIIAVAGILAKVYEANARLASKDTP